MKILDIIKTNSTGDMKKHIAPIIEFLGDSVTQGCFELYQTKDGGFDTVFLNDYGYHAKLKSLFDMVFPQASVSIINAGISGDVSPNGAERVYEDVISHNPHLAIVCYGLNDSYAGSENVDKYADGLKNIFRQLKEADIDTIFMTPNMKATYVTRELGLENFEETLVNNVKNQADGIMDLYMEKAIEVCREENITVCDCYSKWKTLEKHGADITRLLSNRVNHPTEQMHWLFAWSLFETIMDFN